MQGGSSGSSCPPLATTQTSFVNLTPSGVAQGTPFDVNENDPVPGADAGMSVPAGWNFYNFPGAMCRDGSPLGIYVRYGSVNKLMMYLEGGGVCISSHFCDHNPSNMNQVFPNGSLNGESFSGSLATVSGLPGQIGSQGAYRHLRVDRSLPSASPRAIPQLSLITEVWSCDSKQQSPITEVTLP